MGDRATINRASSSMGFDRAPSSIQSDRASSAWLSASSVPACPTPPRLASEDRQGSEEDRQRNLWQGNEDHLPIPLPLIPLPNQMRHRQDATALTTAQLFNSITSEITGIAPWTDHHPTAPRDLRCISLLRGAWRQLRVGQSNSCFRRL